MSFPSLYSFSVRSYEHLTCLALRTFAVGMHIFLYCADCVGCKPHPVCRLYLCNGVQPNTGGKLYPTESAFCTRIESLYITRPVPRLKGTRHTGRTLCPAQSACSVKIRVLALNIHATEHITCPYLFQVLYLKGNVSGSVRKCERSFSWTNNTTLQIPVIVPLKFVFV